MLDKKEIVFVSTNKNKIEEFNNILKELKCDVKIISHKDLNIDLSNFNPVEIQGTPLEVAVTKAKYIFKKFKVPILTEDSSLCFNSLGGMPGPYIKDFYEKIGNDGLVKILSAYSDKTAYAQCIICYIDQDGNTKEFIGRVNGEIVDPCGQNGFAWDSIFKPVDSDKTFGQMTKVEKDKISQRMIAIRKFTESFKKLKNM